MFSKPKEKVPKPHPINYAVKTTVSSYPGAVGGKKASLSPIKKIDYGNPAQIKKAFNEVMAKAALRNSIMKKPK